MLWGGCGGPGAGEERSPGETAFRANCQTCHRLPRADTKTNEEWPAIVERYGARAKLDEATRLLILGYLQKANDTQAGSKPVADDSSG